MFGGRGCGTIRKANCLGHYFKKKKLSKHTPNLDGTLKNTKLLLQLNTKFDFFLNQETNYNLSTKSNKT